MSLAGAWQAVHHSRGRPRRSFRRAAQPGSRSESLQALLLIDLFVCLFVCLCLLILLILLIVLILLI